MQESPTTLPSPTNTTRQEVEELATRRKSTKSKQNRKHKKLGTQGKRRKSIAKNTKSKKK